MTLIETLRGAGVEVTPFTESTVPVAPKYGSLERLGTVERENLTARFEGAFFLVVALSVYRDGDIAEEWCVSAGAPPGTPRTLYGLRDGRWVFLGSRGDTQWKTIPLGEVFRPGVSREA